MASKPALLLAALVLLLVPACATTGGPGQPVAQGNWALYGQVESIRQYVVQDHGNPAGGAAAGAVIGGVLGTALGGRGLGTFLGAAEGAMIGANASQGGYVGQDFQVFVRFDDGSLRSFVYHDQLPFRQGDYVVWTDQGLFLR